jgi:hypothetical protein
MLGSAYGFNQSYKSTAQKLLIVQEIAKMLTCPSQDRETVADVPYQGDYCCNNNLGDIRGQDPHNISYRRYSSWAFFKHFNEVPDDVLVAIDAAPVLASNDDRFIGLSDLLTTNLNRPYARRDSSRGEGQYAFLRRISPSWCSAPGITEVDDPSTKPLEQSIGRIS